MTTTAAAMYLRDIKGIKHNFSCFPKYSTGWSSNNADFVTNGRRTIRKTAINEDYLNQILKSPFCQKFIFLLSKTALLMNFGNLVRIANYNISRTALFKSALLEDCDDCTL